MTKSAAGKTNNLKFEAALGELEQLIATMEAGQLPLEEALAAYQRGTTLLKHCQQQLEDAEEKVRILNQGLLQPLDVESTHGENP